ncbi:MAG: 50S ribosomal protein L6 [Planctomycetota bacterium]|jgi:large subunit ribosomal protein L6
MSRIGKQPVNWAAGTEVSMSGKVLTVKRDKVTLTQEVDPAITAKLDDGERTLTFERSEDTRKARSLHGLYRALAANMVAGVEKGFEKRLEIQGVGYQAKVQGKDLVLNIGFNQPVKMPVPAGLACEAPTPTQIIIKGADRQLVGQFAADVRAVRKPEPYKGKGIRYEGEYVRRKVGKSLGA